MPSDIRIPQALDGLAEPIQAFRSMLANTSEQIRLLISTRVERNGSSLEVARAELGKFAAGRIDPDRMAKLLAQVDRPPIEHGEVVARALEVCNELLGRRHSLFCVELEEGQDLHAAVGEALAQIGRAFAATRVVELITRGEYDASEHAMLLYGHPFEDWSHAERDVGLALVVSLAGRYLRVGGLADFLDRSLRLVLVVDGEAPPAPLVRLITPRTLVMQTADPSEVKRIAGHDGPAVVALMHEGPAQFRHDPARGPTLAERMVITSLPQTKPRRLGFLSAFQQRQDLAQLEALAVVPQASEQDPASAASPEALSVQASVASSEKSVPPSARSGAPASADAADRLSAWLLEQADLPSPS
jgi:hypothetical protein